MGKLHTATLCFSFTVVGHTHFQVVLSALKTKHKYIVEIGNS
jgi:hypothetical protein